MNNGSTPARASNQSTPGANPRTFSLASTLQDNFQTNNGSTLARASNESTPDASPSKLKELDLEANSAQRDAHSRLIQRTLSNQGFTPGARQTTSKRDAKYLVNTLTKTPERQKTYNRPATNTTYSSVSSQIKLRSNRTKSSAREEGSRSPTRSRRPDSSNAFGSTSSSLMRSPHGMSNQSTSSPRKARTEQTQRSYELVEGWSSNELKQTSGRTRSSAREKGLRSSTQSIRPNSPNAFISEMSSSLMKAPHRISNQLTSSPRKARIERSQELVAGRSPNELRQTSGPSSYTSDPTKQLRKSLLQQGEMESCLKRDSGVTIFDDGAQLSQGMRISIDYEALYNWDD